MQVQNRGQRAQGPCLRAHGEVRLCPLVCGTPSASWLIDGGRV